MSKPRPTVILDEPCARLRDAVAEFAPVFVFKASGGFLFPPLQAAEELTGTLAMAGCNLHVMAVGETVVGGVESAPAVLWHVGRTSRMWVCACGAGWHPAGA